MDTATAALKLGVSRMTVRRYAASGRLLGAYRRGRDWWVPSASVDRLLADRDPSPREATAR